MASITYPDFLNPLNESQLLTPTSISEENITSLGNKILVILESLPKQEGKSRHPFDPSSLQTHAVLIARLWLEIKQDTHVSKSPSLGTHSLAVLPSKGKVYILGLAFLGEGAAKSVYRAIELTFNREVAGKFVAEQRSVAPFLKISPKLKVDLMREMLVDDGWAKRIDSPYVVPPCNLMFRIRGARKEAVLVMIQVHMDFSLKAVVMNEVACSSVELLKIALGLAKGLHALHEQGIVHRDLKVDNCLVLHNPEEIRGVIWDLGTAACLREVINDIKGNILYRPPEVLREERYYDPGQYSPAGDMWAFGLILYELFHPEHKRVPYLRGLTDESQWGRVINFLPPVFSRDYLFEGWPIETELDGLTQGVIAGVLTDFPEGRMTAEETAHKIEHILNSLKPKIRTTSQSSHS